MKLSYREAARIVAVLGHRVLTLVRTISIYKIKERLSVEVDSNDHCETASITKETLQSQWQCIVFCEVEIPIASY